MLLSDQLTDYIHAAFTGLWVHTNEPDEAEREIVQHAREREWKVAVWDIANGLRMPGRRLTIQSPFGSSCQDSAIRGCIWLKSGCRTPSASATAAGVPMASYARPRVRYVSGENT